MPSSPASASFSGRRNSLALMKRFLAIFLFLGCIVAATAQSREWTLMHQGNKAFRAGDYKTAEDNYRRALAANPHSTRAAFNLGDAYLAQKNGKDALQQFVAAAKGEQNKLVKAMAYHNVGYIHHLNKDYDKAIDAYKEALRNNPADEDTRYNLVLAQKQKKYQNQNKNQNQQDKKQQEKPQNKPQQQQSQNQPPQSQQQQQQQMSRDNAEQLLNLSRQAEQQTRRKLQDAQPRRAHRLDKNW